MPNEGFCEPCQAFLRGEREPCGTDNKNRPLYKHHANAESFKRALEMECPLCVRIWMGLGEPTQLVDTKHSSVERSIPGLRIDNWNVTFSQDIRSVVNVAYLSLIGSDSVEYPPIQTSLSSYTGSASALDYLASALDLCQTTHTQCRLLRSSNGFLLKRLIDVGKSDDSIVCLRESSDLTHCLPYAALSHCWGGVQPISLTAKTTTKLYQGLPVHELPQTFQDAVLVCRRLQVRYIWIDSLCICQDDLGDWATEASFVREIYSNAIFTIAATDAKDGSEGLFWDRESARYPPVQVDVAWKFDAESTDGELQPSSGGYLIGTLSNVLFDITSAPLNRRGWVLQERYLSPRAMHFTSKYLYWECMELFVSEIYSAGLPQPHPLLYRSDSHSLKVQNFFHKIGVGAGQTEPGGNASELAKRVNDAITYQSWTSLRAIYTSCHLTYEKDVLVAIAGVAREVADMFRKQHSSTSELLFPVKFHDAFVAGMWRHRFHEELCWSANGMHGLKRPDAWRAPTWSWASSTCTIVPSTSEIIACSALSTMADIIDVDVETKTSGEVTRGILRLGCRPVSAALGDAIGGRLKGEYHLSLTNEALEFTETSGCHILMDINIADVSTRDVLAIAMIQWRDSVASRVTEGIVLIPSPTQPNVFNRIGKFDTRFKPTAFSRFIAQHKKAEYKVLTII